MERRPNPDEDACAFARAHDDGRADRSLAAAHVVLVGVSGTGKTTISGELAKRGWRVANVPLTEDGVLPPLARETPVVALIIQAALLQKIRRSRFGWSGQRIGRDYCRIDAIRRELLAARRRFLERGWPVVDVSQQTPAETADLIVALLAHKDAAGS